MDDAPPQTPDNSSGSPQRPGVAEVGLILAIGVLLAGLLLVGRMSPATLATTFYLALFIHIVTSAADGRFDGRRWITWTLLIAAWVAAEVTAFVAIIAPWRQFSFWLANTVANVPLIGSRLSSALTTSAAWPGASWLGLTVVLVLLLIDIIAMHHARWRQMSRPQRTLLAAAAVVAAWILAPLIGQLALELPADSIRLYPEWYMLPLYSLLRSVPDKLAGMLLVLAAMLAPLALPWAGIDRVCGRLPRGIWIVLSLALAGCWIWLGALALLPPDDPALSPAPALAGFHFAYFLLLPFLFRGLARYVRARREEATTVR